MFLKNMYIYASKMYYEKLLNKKMLKQFKTPKIIYLFFLFYY